MIAAATGDYRNFDRGTSEPCRTTAWDATPWVPAAASIDVLRAAAASCEGCPLYIDTTQVVFGAGSPEASLILVGEQPGDQEDHTISTARKQPVGLGSRTVHVTSHPSAVLRADDRAEEYRAALTEDLSRAWKDATS